MEVGHSRLLKFLNQHRPKMPVQQKYTIEILNPTAIESDVPKQQPLRHPSQDDSDSKMADDLNKMADSETKMADGSVKNDDSNYVHVYSSKREEAVFTKGDLKLQKAQKVPNPLYSEVYSEVIIGPQPIRVLNEDLACQNGDNKMAAREKKDTIDDSEDNPPEKKPKSRIPTMRLRHAAEMVKRERRESAGKELKEEVPTAQPRRSSIPRRRRQSYKSPPPPKRESGDEKTQSNEENNNNTTCDEKQATVDIVITNKDDEAVSLEEFDKLYDEIIHTDESLPFIECKVQLLPKVDNLEDPVSLENTFEEMMHDYEANKVEPIDAEDITSKIPLLKQKSLPEGEFIKRIDRRQSLKDSSVDDVKTKDVVRKSRRSNLNEIKKTFDRNAKEDLKEHKRLTKEILKRPDKETKGKQTKDIKSKYFKGKVDPKENESCKTNLAKKDGSAPPAKPNETNVPTQTSIETIDSVIVATPVPREQNKAAHKETKEVINKKAKQTDLIPPKQLKESYEMPKSTKIVQNINKHQNAFKIETDDGRPLIFENTLPAEKRQTVTEKDEKKQIHKIETENGQPLLFENVLPVENREYLSGSVSEDIAPKHDAEEFILKCDPIKNEDDINKEKLEPSKPSVPSLRGKVSKLASKFTLNEPHSPPLPIKELNNNDVPKKKTILSKIAIFNKDKHDGVKENNTMNKLRDEKTAVVNNKRKITYKDKTKDSEKEIGLYYKNNEPIIAIGINKSLHDPKSKDELDVQRDLDKPKFIRTASVPLDISNKFKIRSHITTPPNTPQISFYPDAIEKNNKETLKQFEHVSDKLNVVKVENNQPINEHLSEDTIHYKDNDSNRDTNTDFKDYHVNGKPITEMKSKSLDNADKSDPLIVIKDEIVYYQDFETHKDKIDSQIKNNLSVDENKTHDRQPSFVANDKVEEGEHLDLKGKVSQIINRIDSIEENAAEQTKKEIDVPIKKSVSSRIAMFERQTSSNPQLPNYKITTNGNKENTKPRIIEEVLKAPPPRIRYDGDINQKDAIPKTNMETSNHERDLNQNIPLAKDGDQNCAFQEEIIKETQYEIQVIDLESALESNTQESVSKNTIDDRAIEIQEEKQSKEISNQLLDKKPTREILKEREMEHISQREKVTTVTKIDERLRKIQSVNEETNSRKTKSVAEIDLGNAVKGKVSELIKRINSMESLNIEKNLNREDNEKIISAKEMPRKKSVFEKIALFEQKTTLTSVNFEMAPPTVTTTTHATDSTAPPETTPTPTTTPTDPSPRAPTEPTVPPNPSDATFEPTKNAALDAIYRGRIEDFEELKQKYAELLNKTEMQYFELNDGNKIPVLCLGMALVDPVILPHLVGAAIEVGVRGIDTAYIYGNERAVGEAIRAKIAGGTVKRNELYVIGKLWSNSHRTDLVEGACRASLEALGLEYFDLYLIHNPMSFKEGSDPVPKIANVLQYSEEADYLDAWFGMEGLVAKGLAKSIGVSNFNSEQIARVVEKGKVRPVVNQVECHPYLTQQRLGDFCAEYNIMLMCFGALGSAGTPKELRDNLKPVIQDPTVKELAEKLKMTPAQLLLRFQIQRGHPVVIKSSSAAHLWENLEVLQQEIDEDAVSTLLSLNKNKRTYALKGLGDTHRNYPFKANF